MRPDFIRSFSCCVFFFRSRGGRECDNGRHNKGTTIRDDATRVLSWTPSVSSARRYPNRARYKGFAAGVATLLQHVLVPADVTKWTEEMQTRREKKKLDKWRQRAKRSPIAGVASHVLFNVFFKKKKRTRVYSLFDYITYRFLQTLLEGRWVCSANAGMAVSTWISLIFELAGFARSWDVTQLRFPFLNFPRTRIVFRTEQGG